MAVENGWGQGAVNNSNDYGKAKANSTNGFGKIYETSNSGLTNIEGGDPVVSISYAFNSFCADASDPTPTVFNNAGAGVFSSTTGLVINSTTGVIDIDASTASTYTVTYTDSDAATAIFDLTIHALPTVIVSTSAGTICDGESTTLTATGAASYVWSNGSTGNLITVSPTTTTTFTATGTDSNGCVSSGGTTITVNPQDSAAFSYAASAYCANGTDPTPTITGTAGGAFTSTAGLVINSGTGAIDLDTSTVGAYSITYTTTGACPDNQSTNLTINAADNAAFSYSASSFEPTDANPTPTITGLTGGTFSGTTGLVINSTTGEIDLSASTVASHIITYDTTSSGSSVCPNTSTQTVEIAVAGIANNYSMNFDSASSDYIDAGNPTELQITGALSISLWFKTNTTPSGNAYLLSKGTGSYTQRNFGIWQSNSNTIRAFINGIDAGVTSPNTYADNSWHHCVVTYTPNTSLILYIDGSSVDTDTTSIPSAINNNASNLEIGRWVSDYFDGQIDEVGIWNTALTSTQVAEIYNATGTNLTKDLTTVSGSNLKYFNRMGD